MRATQTTLSHRRRQRCLCLAFSSAKVTAAIWTRRDTTTGGRMGRRTWWPPGATLTGRHPHRRIRRPRGLTTRCRPPPRERRVWRHGATTTHRQPLRRQGHLRGEMTSDPWSRWLLEQFHGPTKMCQPPRLCRRQLGGLMVAGQVRGRRAAWLRRRRLQSTRPRSRPQRKGRQIGPRTWAAGKGVVAPCLRERGVRRNKQPSRLAHCVTRFLRASRSQAQHPCRRRHHQWPWRTPPAEKLRTDVAALTSMATPPVEPTGATTIAHWLTQAMTVLRWGGGKICRPHARWRAFGSGWPNS
mmetsp:Transcript_97425/g.275546  ORF Transcript_97425/g.275546 Transcript_97425/m.275546 type:complete len:298 (-) Transcript_97425:1097-1990(-)